MRRLRVGVVSLLVAGIGLACLSTYNRPKVTARTDVPPLDGRSQGCSVQVFEGKPDRPWLDIADITLDWPRGKITQQGPEGAINTLKQTACEQGAFYVYDMRALSTGAEEGLVYEAVLATMLGDDGKPINLKRLPADAGSAPASADPGSGTVAP